MFKRFLIFACVLLSANSILSAADHIILRDGRESDVKLIQINDSKIVFLVPSGKTMAQQELPASDVYMVYIEKQGNVYITPEGKRRTGESKRVDPKKQDAVYLVDGAEIGCEDIKIDDEGVSFTIKSNSGNGLKDALFAKSGANKSIVTFPKSNVFMIRYKSGMVDVITPFGTLQDAPVAEETTDDTPKMVVVWHAVKRGETLAKVAEIYNVTTDDIIEWNDLSKRTRPSAPLAVGSQLMIYQPQK